jgi:hypothetical protein
MTGTRRRYTQQKADVYVLTRSRAIAVCIKIEMALIDKRPPFRKTL